MEWVETTGRTIEEAKDAALDQLGVDDSDAEFEILEEPKFGLFGRLRSGARVRARVRPTKPRPKEEHRDRRGRRRVGGAAGPGSSTSATLAVEGTDSAATGGSGTRAEPAKATDHPDKRVGDADPGDDSGRGAEDDDEDTAASGDGTAQSGASSGSRRRGRQRGRGPRPSAPDSDDGQATDASSAEPRQPQGGGRRSAPSGSGARRQQSDSQDDSSGRGGGMDVSLDEQGAIGMEFLKGLVDRLSLDAAIAMARPDEDTIELNLEGDDLGMLIGAKGATLLAIQDLTRTVVQRKTSAGNGRLVVDVAGYRRKRKEALERFARRLAEEVLETGTQRVLEPMTAADRKIVHDTANQLDGVETMSEGEDPNRRVVILPTSR